MMDGNLDPKSRRFAPKEVRKQQLIDATLEVISEKGVSGTTTSQVTSRAGLSAGLISLHFKTKDNLLRSTLEYLAVELAERWQEVQTDETLTSEEKLWGIISASFAPDICTHVKVRVWFAFFGEAEYRGFYREMVEKFDTERADAIADVLVELGQSPDEALGTVQTIEGVADGLWLSLMLYPDWIDIETCKIRVWNLLNKYFPDRFALSAQPDAVTP